MTSAVAIVLAVSLLLNEVHLLYNTKIVKDQHLESCLVFVLSACLLLKRLNVFPKMLWAVCPSVCYFLELPLSLALLETSIYYVWKSLQCNILMHSDDILVLLSEYPTLDWLVCHFCCGHNNCSSVIGNLVLRAASFSILIPICFYFAIKKT